MVCSGGVLEIRAQGQAAARVEMLIHARLGMGEWVIGAMPGMIESGYIGGIHRDLFPIAD